MSFPAVGAFRRENVAEYDDPPRLPAPQGVRCVEREIRDFPDLEVPERKENEAEQFYQRYLNRDSDRTALVWSIRRHHVEALDAGCTGIGVLQKVNNARWVNKFFRAVNSRLEAGGVFAGCAEVNGQRKARFFRTYPVPLVHLRYAIDFAAHRIWPKIPLVNKVYFSITRGHDRPMAESEVLGRLISCGFEIIEHRNIDGLLYFAVRKVRDATCVISPTYGPFCSLRRVGRGERVFTVFKFRTMHPYAEFLQHYVYERNQLQDGGKFRDDFRITPWGRWLRRLWLDELPMLLNVLKGEMKLVGVRPLSEQYYGLYPPEAREVRKRHTPGLLPPFYVDLPKTFEGIVASELKYLRAYEKAPLRTDLRYFTRALWNILVKKARSA